MRSSGSSSAARFLPEHMPEEGKEYSLVLAAGRGVRDAEGVSLLLEAARRLHAPVAATRGAVEDGLLPASHMVGTSGKRIACRVCLCLGSSGSNFHTVGFRGVRLADSTFREPAFVAVNPDPKARIHVIASKHLYEDCKSVLQRILAGDEELYGIIRL